MDGKALRPAKSAKPAQSAVFATKCDKLLAAGHRADLVGASTRGYFISNLYFGGEFYTAVRGGNSPLPFTSDGPEASRRAKMFRIRMQRIPMAAQRADANTLVRQLLLEPLRFRRVLQHRQLAMRVPRMVPRRQLDRTHPRLFTLASRSSSDSADNSGVNTPSFMHSLLNPAALQPRTEHLPRTHPPPGSAKSHR